MEVERRMNTQYRSGPIQIELKKSTQNPLSASSIEIFLVLKIWIVGER
jgi:hypothetical protein